MLKRLEEFCRHSLAVSVLGLIFACSAIAGEIPTPTAPPPVTPHGYIHTGIVPDPESGVESPQPQGEIECGIVGEMDRSLPEIAMHLLGSVLLF